MPIPNFHQLHIFHTVVRLGSFSQAARELNISQPAVSIQVRELERSLGCRLIQRRRRGLALTDTGEAVYRYTSRIFALAREMADTVQDIKGLRTGHLSVGSSTTPGEYILPWAIARFQERYPGIDISLSIHNTGVILEKIQNMELDLGMAGAPVETDSLASFPYVNDEIVFIAPCDHPLARRGRLTLEDLSGQRLVLRERGSATRKAAQERLRHCGLQVRVVMELGSNEAVKGAVAAGLGLGLLSRFAVTADAMAGLLRVLQVEGWECRRPLVVFYRRDRELPPAQRAFLDFLKTERPLPHSMA